MLQSDYLKPAPCVTNEFLALIRVVSALILVIQTIYSLAKSEKISNLYYISQWNLLLLTILFVVMAVVQLKNAKRLNSFKLDMKSTRPSARSFSSDDDTVNSSQEMPWLFWKWIIPCYISVVCMQAVLFFDFLIAELSKDPFLIYTTSEDKLVWLLLPSLPMLLILIEYPFN